MLDLTMVRTRLLAVAGTSLRDVDISTNLEDAMAQTVRAPRAWLMDLGESFGRNALGGSQVSQVVTVEFGVLIAVPDERRGDQQSPLQVPRNLVRQALLGWAPSEAFTAFEGRRGRLMAAGPVQWWLDTFATEYVTTGV